MINYQPKAKVCLCCEEYVKGHSLRRNVWNFRLILRCDCPECSCFGSQACVAKSVKILRVHNVINHTPNSLNNQASVCNAGYLTALRLKYLYN